MDISKKDFKIIFNATKNFNSAEFNNVINMINNNTITDVKLKTVLNNNDKNSVVNLISKLNNTLNNSDSEESLFIQQGAANKGKGAKTTTSATSSAVPKPKGNSATSSVAPKKDIKITPVTKKSSDKPGSQKPIGEEAKESIQKLKNFLKEKEASFQSKQAEIGTKEASLDKLQAELKESQGDHST